MPHRDQATTNPTNELICPGVQAVGELTDTVNYWMNAAYVTGETSELPGAPDIHGFGVDLVVTYAPDLAWEPSVSLGFAFGSGDGDPGDGVNRNFRQTGLQENNASFNGVARFKYYGEVLDPELSNLAVMTFGAGINPIDNGSLDLVYHYYLQHHAADGLSDSNLDAEPDGRHRELGHGLDLVLGYHGIDDLSAKIVVGAFLPGRAFAEDVDNAYYASFELQFAF